MNKTCRNVLVRALFGLLASHLPDSTRGQGAAALEIGRAQNLVELRWRTPVGTQSSRLPTFQIESSDDLRHWSPLGPAIKPASADELHLRSFATDKARAFYRVLTRYDPSLAKAVLASGGADVFGYSTAFASELAKIGRISPDEFASRFPAPRNYLERITFDVTQARYFSDFSADPEAVNATRLPGVELMRFRDFRLTPAEMAVFKKNGFVVSERQSAPNFAEPFYSIWEDHLPVFISTDAILHAWHRTFDSMLEELEETILYENLDHLLDGMAGKVAEAAAQAGGGVLKDSVLDADYFLAVARSLLDGHPVPGALSQDARVAKTLAAIREAEPKFDPCFDLFGAPRAVDFSEFKVRGHYVNSPRLGRYFQCVMWLGRTDLRLAGGPFADSDCTDPHPAPPRELGTAVVLQWLLNRSGLFENWRQFERVITTFVGWTDSATFAQLGDLLAAAKVTALTDLPDLASLLRLQDRIAQGQVGVQNIRADYFISPFGPEQVRLPQSFTVFGQKFVPDSWALAQSVFDSIVWDEDGIPDDNDKVRRRVPSALDVAFSTLGNDQAVPELLARLKDTSATRHRFRDGFNYQHNLAAVRRVMDSQGTSAWTSNLYMDWLGTLRELSMPLTASNYPQALRTRAWAMKSLNTQLASWSQLRHDTILYAKQSRTVGDACGFPAALVEPHPTFWVRMRDMVDRTRNAIEQLTFQGRARFVYRPFGRGVDFAELEKQLERDPASLTEDEIAIFGDVGLSEIQARQLDHLSAFTGVLTMLDAITQRQQTDPASNLEPYLQLFICNWLELVGVGGCGPWRYSGWYPQLFYRSFLHERNTKFHEDSGVHRFDAIVADVHTDPPTLVVGDPGSVLHQGLGRVNMAYIAVEFGGKPVMFAGPVLSHHEFELIGPPRRLADSEWANALETGEAFAEPLYPEWRKRKDEAGNTRRLPPLPPWTRDYLVPVE